MRCPVCSHGANLVSSRKDEKDEIYTEYQIFWCDFCNKAYSIHNTRTKEKIKTIYSWK